MELKKEVREGAPFRLSLAAEKLQVLKLAILGLPAEGCVVDAVQVAGLRSLLREAEEILRSEIYEGYEHSCVTCDILYEPKEGTSQA